MHAPRTLTYHTENLAPVEHLVEEELLYPLAHADEAETFQAVLRISLKPAAPSSTISPAIAGFYGGPSDAIYWPSRGRLREAFAR